MVFETDADTATRLPIHTTPTRPNCHALNAWLDREGIDFNKRDLTTRVVMEEALTHYGVRVAPLIAGDDWFANGNFAKHIYRNFKPGDAVQIERWLGSFWFRHSHIGPILAVAGGSGLAPIQSIVKTALLMGMAQPIHLCFGRRTIRDRYQLHHLHSLAGQHRNLHFIPVLCAESGVTPLRMGYVGSAIADDIKDLDGWRPYTDGSPVKIETMTARLRHEDLHADVFFTQVEGDALQRSQG